MKKIKIFVDLGEEQIEVDGYLVEGKHALYIFDEIIWFAPNVTRKGSLYMMSNGEVMLGMTKNGSEKLVRDMLNKLKSTTLLDYFTLYHDMSLDYDFNLV